jgi:hydroxymethylpyrimidine pyrophosphatase-like HAD family hydrolase
MIIAVGFDGTIVKHKYPMIGEEVPNAIDTLRLLKKRGHQLILWTYRTGELLEEAVEFCRDNGLEFYAVNQNFPEECFDESVSRKIYADIYIDDRNVGENPEWNEIFQMIEGIYEEEEVYENKATSFFSKIFGN